MMRKMAVFLFTAIFAASVFGFATPAKVSAAACGSDSDANFLSFPTWHRGFTCDGDRVNLQNEKLGNVVLKIGLNILDMGLRIAGMVAVGFVIYGGFLYTTSNGSPEKAKQGLDAIIKSLVGMVLAAAAAILVSFIVGNIT